MFSCNSADVRAVSEQGKPSEERMGLFDWEELDTEESIFKYVPFNRASRRAFASGLFRNLWQMQHLDQMDQSLQDFLQDVILEMYAKIKGTPQFSIMSAA